MDFPLTFAQTFTGPGLPADLPTNRRTFTVVPTGFPQAFPQTGHSIFVMHICGTPSDLEVDRPRTIMVESCHLNHPLNSSGARSDWGLQ